MSFLLKYFYFSSIIQLAKNAVINKEVILLIIEVQTWRKDNIDETTLKNDFYKLGWMLGAEGGIANKSFIFIWKNEDEPKFPEGYECTIINQ